MVLSFDSNDIAVEANGATSDKNPSLGWSGYRTITGANDEWRQIQAYANVDYNFMNRGNLLRSRFLLNDSRRSK